jgi:hypothetical protein
VKINLLLVLLLTWFVLKTQGQNEIPTSLASCGLMKITAGCLTPQEKIAGC